MTIFSLLQKTCNLSQKISHLPFLTILPTKFIVLPFYPQNLLIFSSWCHPLRWCHLGKPAPSAPLMTPLSPNPLLLQQFMHLSVLELTIVIHFLHACLKSDDSAPFSEFSMKQPDLLLTLLNSLTFPRLWSISYTGFLSQLGCSLEFFS